MVQADHFAGYPSRSVVKYTRKMKPGLVSDEEFDVVIERPGVPWDEVHWRCLIDLLWHGDIWSAYFDCLFFETDEHRANVWVFRLLHWAGIRIVVAPHGGDIAYKNRFVDRYDTIARKQRDYPQWSLSEFSAPALERIALFCRYASLVLGADSNLQRFLPRKDIVFKYFPIDCDVLRPSEVTASRRTMALIMHAPNHRSVKGTDYLIAAVARLQEAGIACELELLEGVPRTDALLRYQEADIIADQFCIGAFGAFATEGLALGKPVLTYLDQEHLGDPVFNLPLVNTNVENIERVLAVLVQVPALRERLGRLGRESVEAYQSVSALAEVWDQIYRHIWWGETLDLAKTRHFGAERKPRAYTEDPAQPEFWPVPVTDLMPFILSALLRLEQGSVAPPGSSG